MRRVTYYAEFIGDDVIQSFDKTYHFLRRELRPKDPWFGYSLTHSDIHHLFVSIEEIDPEEGTLLVLQTGLMISKVQPTRWMGAAEFQNDMNIPDEK